MPERLNIHLRFFLRSTHQNGDGLLPVVLRLVYRGQRRDIFTGLYTEEKAWDKKGARLFRIDKKAAALNQNLDLVERKALEAFDALHYGGLHFSIDELVEKIKGREAPPQSLMEYLEQEKASLLKRVGVDIAPATCEKYRRSASHVQAFLLSEYKVKNLPLVRIDTPFLEKYFQYLRTTKNLSHNVAVKYLTFFKTILIPALKRGTIRQDPFTGLKLRQKPVMKGYLTATDVKLLKAAELKSRDLERVRDIFLFCCYTGLAYSDVRGLTRGHILKQQEGVYCIRKPRQKTGQESLVPLLPAAKAILQKYSVSADFRDFCWQVSSNQKMNQRLKTIGQLAGIDQVLHMHLARHTFATTVTLSNGVPIESVSAMLGHASLKQTQHYAKIIAQKLFSDMAKINGLYQ